MPGLEDGGQQPSKTWNRGGRAGLKDSSSIAARIGSNDDSRG